MVRRFSFVTVVVVLCTGARAQSRDACAPVPATANFSAAHCAASRTFQGRATRLAPRLKCEGGPLLVVALGVSITAGTHIFPKGDRAASDASCALLRDSACASGAEELQADGACRGLAWPAVLERRLNEAFPCESGEKHRVVPHPKPGDGSEYHVQRLRDCLAYRAGTVSDADLRHKLRTQGTCQDLSHADVVVVDTVINDHATTTQAQTEHLVRLLRQLPTRPALYWLAASFFHEWDHRPGLVKNHVEVLEAQAEVLEYYEVPLVSMLGAMAADLENQAGRDAWKPYFTSDDRHPTAWGHSVLGETMFCNLRGDAEPSKPAGPNNEEPLPPLKFATEAEGAFYYVESDLGDPATVARVTAGGSGFTVHEDVPGKPGLIGYEERDTVILQPLESHHAGPGCQLALTYLISYEHMGMIRASVFTTPGDGGEAATATIQEPDRGVCDPAMLNTTVGEPAHVEWIDTAVVFGRRNGNSDVKEKVSVARSKIVGYTIPEKVACTWLEVQIEHAADHREENKVKLLRFTTKCPALAGSTMHRAGV